MKRRTVFFGFASAAAGAAGALYIRKQLEKEENRRKVYDLGNDAIQGVLKGAASIFPDAGLPDAVSYDSPDFMEGHSVFASKPAKDVAWRLGYAKANLIPDDVGTGGYYMGGYLSASPSIVEDVLDGQFFRCVCMDDGSGRGAVVFGVIDCAGISGNDVRRIRNTLKEFASQNNIVSINISATRSHTCIDTLGPWGDPARMFRENPKAAFKGENEGFVSGRNEKFMAELCEKAAEAVRTAFHDMKTGDLYSATIDGARFVRPWRTPDVAVSDITTLRFVPDDKNSRATRFVCMGANPIATGQKSKTISADYPYYICEAFENEGENGIFFQGTHARAAFENGGEDAGLYDGIKEYGAEIALCCRNLDKSLYEKVEPVLNVRLTEVFLPVSNYGIMLLSKLRIVNSNTIKAGSKPTDLRFVTEVGYAEIGGNLKVALIPGELMPEILTGGALGADEAYNRYEWEYPALGDLVDGKLLCVGLCNDAIGYIVPDNDFGSMVAPRHFEEVVSAGGKTASILVKAFMHLVDRANELKDEK